MTLYGHDASPKEEKYTKAWSDLYNHNASSDDRCHAKTWLTYRAIDREITPQDYASKVLRVDTLPNSLRWEVSLAAAHIYYSIIIERQTPHHLISSVLERRPDDLSITNSLRVHALASYSAFLRSDHEFVHGCFSEAMLKWKNTISGMTAFHHMSRLLEVQNDPPVLLFMRLLVEMSVHGRYVTEPPLIANMEKTQRGLTWWRAMLSMQIRDGALW